MEKTGISGILQTNITQLVSKSRGAEYGKAVSAALAETLDVLGQGIERKLDGALAAQGIAPGKDARQAIVDNVGQLMAEKLTTKVILPQLNGVSNIRGAVTPLADIKEALGSLTEAELDTLTKKEIDAAITAKPTTVVPEPKAPAKAPPAPRPPVAPRSYSSGGSWGGKYSSSSRSGGK